MTTDGAVQYSTKGTLIYTHTMSYPILLLALKGMEKVGQL